LLIKSILSAGGFYFAKAGNRFFACVNSRPLGSSEQNFN
jgi:hypothetical protein